jgi:SAM-dependent methyltransferase
MRVITAERPAGEQQQWFSTWFDSSHYHQLYGYRDQAEAATFIDALVTRLHPDRQARMLDLGCGTGRHANYLASKGFRVTGLDLAAGSIREAERHAPSTARFARHDMREPFGDGAFDYVFNFFTSFGYFDTLNEHLAVVWNIAHALRVGGEVVMDYLNVRHAEARLTPSEVKSVDGVTYRITRWCDARHFYKRLIVEDPRLPRSVQHVERVAKFTLCDFQCLFAIAGLSLEDVCGDYQLGPYDALESPRMILIARKRRQPAQDCAADPCLDRFLRIRESVSGVSPRYDASIHCGTRDAIDG